MGTVIIGVPAAAPAPPAVPYVARGTVADFCASVLRYLGVLGAGETAQIEDATTAMEALNDLLDSWSLDRTFIYKLRTDAYDFVSGQQDYEIGPGAADFSSNARPIKIEYANVIINDLTYPLRTPIAILEDSEWIRIPMLDLTVGWPSRMTCDYGFPYATISFWPIPQRTYQFELLTWQQLTQVESLTDDLDFPPGYQRMLKTNVAIDLAPEFKRPITGEMLAIAQDSRLKVQSRNSVTPIMRCENVGLTVGGGGFNYLTGE